VSEQNLVILRANTLEVYVVHDEGRTRAAKMDLRATFTLFGDLAGVQRIRRCSSPDLIAIAVLDAKICVVQWDSEKCELKTQKGFTFENFEPSDPLLAQQLKGFRSTAVPGPDGRSSAAGTNLFRANQGNSAVALLALGTQLDIIGWGAAPASCLSSNSAGDDDVKEMLGWPEKGGAEEHTHVSINLVASNKVPEVFGRLTLPQPLVGVRDMAFVSGSSSSSSNSIVVIAILHTAFPVTAGLLWYPEIKYSHLSRDTMNVSCLAIDLNSRAASIISTVVVTWDCSGIVGLQLPVGGFFALSPTVISYCRGNDSIFNIALTSYSFPSSQLRFSSLLSSDLNPADLPIVPCVFAALSNSSAVVIDSKGTVWSLDLKVDCDGHSPRGLSFSPLCSACLPSCACVIPGLTQSGDLIFIGSHLGDSLLARIVIGDGCDCDTDLLLQETMAAEHSISLPPRVEVPGSFLEKRPSKPVPPTKRMRRIYFAPEIPMPDVDPSCILCNLYAQLPPPPAPRKVGLACCDVLFNPAVRGNIVAAKSCCTVEGQEGSFQSGAEFLCSSGYGKQGALVAIRRTAVPEVSTRISLSAIESDFDARMIWVVYAAENDEFQSLVCVSTGGSTRLVWLNRTNRISDRHFITDRSSLLVCNVCGTSYIVQVYRTGVSLYLNLKRKHDLVLSSKEGRCIKAVSSDPLLLLHMDDLTLWSCDCSNGKCTMHDRPIARNVETFCAFVCETGRMHHACAVVTKSGQLLFFELHGMTSLWRCENSNLCIGARMLIPNDTHSVQPPKRTIPPKPLAIGVVSDPHKDELRLVLAVCTSVGDVFVYKSSQVAGMSSWAGLRFVRQNTDTAGVLVAGSGEFSPHIVTFDNISGQHGMFICGNAGGVIVCSRGTPYFHPLALPGGRFPIYAAALHTEEVVHGWVMLTPQSVDVCRWPDKLRLTCAWPTKRFLIGCTVMFSVFLSHGPGVIVAVIRIPWESTGPVKRYAPGRGPISVLPDDEVFSLILLDAHSGMSTCLSSPSLIASPHVLPFHSQTLILSTGDLLHRHDLPVKTHVTCLEVRMLRCSYRNRFSSFVTSPLRRLFI
jgi:hypothetical protein